MSPTQKALFLEKKFGNLVVNDTKVYTPGPGEILIKIKATSLNPVDWKIQKYGLYLDDPDFPAILGTDMAGDVEELGEGVTEFKKGDPVFCQGKLAHRTSTFQQYSTALAGTVARIPENVTYDQASTFPVALSCCYVGLYNQYPNGLGFKQPTSESTRGIYGGIPIVVLGGATSVGQLVIQFAKLSGFYPIITTASVKHTEPLESLGATDVLDRNLDSSSLVTEINRITNNKPIKHVFDAVSSSVTQQHGLDVLAPGGQLAIVYFKAVETPENKKILTILGVWLPHKVELLETLYLKLISRLLEQGIIKPNKIEVLPNGLAGIPDGLARLEAEKVSGLKLVARPQET